MAKVVIHRHQAEKVGLHYDFRFEYTADKAMSIVLRDAPNTFLSDGYSKDCVYTLEDNGVLDIDNMEIEEGYGKGKIELVKRFDDANIEKNDDKIDITLQDITVTIILFTHNICRFITNGR